MDQTPFGVGLGCQKGCYSCWLEMPLRTEGEETIGVSCGKLFEDVFAFTDIKPLKLQADRGRDIDS